MSVIIIHQPSPAIYEGTKDIPNKQMSGMKVTDCATSRIPAGLMLIDVKFTL